jgi:mannose-1-phosphate guanylyltransferase
MEKNKEENVISHSQIFLEEVKNSLIKLPSSITAVIKGLDNYLVIQDNDILLIWPKDKEQEIKSLVNSLKSKIPSNKI